ncbi:MAG: Ig-like domain-containing protein [Rhodoferax sp.]|nr:Ig-like domain-containing protein [Rhodoferax sp.]
MLATLNSLNVSLTKGSMAAPILLADPGPVNFVEGDNTASVRMQVVPDLTITDADSASFASATISITSGFQSGQDVLRRSTDPSVGNVRGVFSSSTGVLTLTSSGATATLAQWQAALRLITFGNDSQFPTGGNRTLSLVLNDGTDNSLAITKTILLSATNDATNLGVGRVTTDFGNDEGGNAIAVMLDGAILVTGPSWVQTSSGGTVSFGSAHYKSDGSLDTSVVPAGHRTAEFVGGAQGAYVYNTTILPGGKSLAYGYIVNDGSTSPPDTRWAIARYNADGTLDASFDLDGKQTIDFRNYSAANIAAAQADGKLLVAGDHARPDGGNFDAAVMRFNGDGSIDTSFGVSGLVDLDFGATKGGGVWAMLALADGGVLLACALYDTVTNGGEVGMMRLNANGTVNASFQSVIVNAGNLQRESPSGLKLQTDGKIVMLVSSTDSSGAYATALFRFNPDGNLDTSFNGTGKVETDLRMASETDDSLAIQPDGKLVLAGSGNGNFVVARYNTDGSPDATFGTNGRVVSDFGAAEQATAVVINADGKILVTGGSTGNFALIRYNTDGSVDTSFGVSALLEVGAGQSVLVDGKAVITDPELATLGYDGTSLTLVRQGGANANDVFLAKPGGSLGPLTEGASLTVDSTVMGTVVTNHGGTLALSFSGGATEALVNSVARQIAYSNGVDAQGSLIQMGWTFNDGNTGGQGPGGAVTTSASSAVRIVDSPPSLVSVSPVNEAVAVALDSDIVLTFSEPITRGEGVLVLRDTVGNVVESFNASTSTRLTLSGNTLAINPSADLLNGTVYSIEFVAGSVRDLTGNNSVSSLGYHFITISTGALILGTTSNDIVAGGADNDTLVANAGDDALDGGVGNDILDGGVGSDILLGGSGNDILLGGAGADTLTGGTGADLYYVDSATDQVVEVDNAVGAGPEPRPGLDLGTTVDKVVASVNFTLTSFVENLSLAANSGSLAGTGNALDNVLVGNEGHNILIGLGGNDRLDGGDGVDTARFTGLRSAYGLSSAAGVVSVSNGSGPDGLDTLAAVERLQFADTKLAVDLGLTQSGGGTALLIGAVLGQSALPAKKALVGAVLDLFDQGYTLQILSGAVMRLDIWGALANGGAASASNTQIANYLFTTVNGTAPDAGTLNAAVTALDTEAGAARGTFLWHLAESAQNQLQVNLVGLAQVGLEYSV